MAPGENEFDTPALNKTPLAKLSEVLGLICLIFLKIAPRFSHIEVLNKYRQNESLIEVQMGICKYCHSRRSSVFLCRVERLTEEDRTKGKRDNREAV